MTSTRFGIHSAIHSDARSRVRWVRTIKTLLSLESLLAGLVEVASLDIDSDQCLKIVPFELKEPDGELIEEPSPNNSMEAPRARETTADFFKTQFGRWRAYALTRPFERDIALSSGLLETVCEIGKLGMFDNAAMHCLCHVDLHSRNIMAEIQSDSSIKITAILDWDEAGIAPKFVNCQPFGGYGKKRAINATMRMAGPPGRMNSK